MAHVSFRQVVFIYLTGVCCFSSFVLPDAVSTYAGKSALFVPFLGALISLPYVYALFRIVKKHGSVSNALHAKWGQKGVKLFAAVSVLWLCLIAVFYLNALYHRLASTAFSYLPRAVCLVAIVLCAALFVSVPHAVIGRSGAIVFIIMALSLAALCVFSIRGVEVKELLPVKYNTFTLFVRALLFPTGISGMLTLLLFEYDAALPGFGSWRRLIFCACGLMAGIIFFTQTVFGVAFSQTLSYPFFALIKSTDSLLQPEHFESLVSGVWIVISVSFFIFLVHLIGVFLNRCFTPVGKTAGFIVALAPSVVILALALAVPENRFLCERVIGSVMPAGNIVLGMVPVCILTLTNRG